MDSRSFGDYLISDMVSRLKNAKRSKSSLVTSQVPRCEMYGAFYRAEEGKDIRLTVCGACHVLVHDLGSIHVVISSHDHPLEWP